MRKNSQGRLGRSGESSQSAACCRLKNGEISGKRRGVELRWEKESSRVFRVSAGREEMRQEPARSTEARSFLCGSNGGKLCWYGMGWDSNKKIMGS